MEAKVYDIKGKEAGKVKLPESVFGISWSGDLVHQVVVAIQSNMRTPVAHTKDRSEVRGGGKKPWRQKGTGRARHGSSRSPIWIGGGVTFGPRNDRNYTKKVNKKMRTKALFAVLSKKFKEGEILFVDDIKFSDPKTVDAKSALDAFVTIKEFEGFKKKKKNGALILLNERDLNTAKSFRNFGSVDVDEVRNLNPFSALSYKYIIISKPEEAVAFFESKLQSKDGIKAKAVKKVEPKKVSKKETK